MIVQTLTITNVTWTRNYKIMGLKNIAIALFYWPLLRGPYHILCLGLKKGGNKAKAKVTLRERPFTRSKIGTHNVLTHLYGVEYSEDILGHDTSSGHTQQTK